MEISDTSLLVDLRAARHEITQTARFDYDGQRPDLPRDEFLIFGLTHEGSGMVSLREPTPTTRTVGPGQAYFLRRPGPYRLWYPAENSVPWSFTFVAVRFYCENEFAWKLAAEYSPVMEVSDDDPLALCVERLAEVFPHPEVRNNRFTRSALAYRFLMALSAHLESHGRRRLSIDLERALAYVEDHLHEDLSLLDLAREMQCSEDTVLRRFRQEMGTSFVRYLTQRRIRRAKRMLLTTDLSVKAIAGATGFRSPSYFCSVFRTSSGKTPATYRETADIVDPDLA